MQLSLSQAVRFLKLQMGDEEYKEALRKARITQFARVVELFSDEFELTEGGYYLTKIG